ncbi:GalNAc(5)-diNAcBac-PP-undecaprenol beta-1,3-glucosyltransferase [Mucilaginibacter gotjawali]|uniref:GalNAc(5)-diNAcBac-PP-undecaprenol beta-1,3-glucosyltransferase n=2 Tax=Mucilaginibacter gotjawali TaxID=1550579 RepID=A0A0X8X475_9SPHI|nr:glycosyltransferase [Mucilaginibacter gotjawali]BAU55379.1 GalNAc(5)-diNAcBac-PP-undecaprenol beta-1,3-glucosyltransferase [Mucilaginibacter gotjawali]
MPRLSVIIPTYNRNDLLSNCLNCLAPEVQLLSLNDYEVIVSDDNTDSQTKKLIEDSFPWVKWVEGPKMGPAANRNNGVKVAQGEWLLFTDDDCLPTDRWISAYSNEIKSGAAKVLEGLTDAERPRKRFDEESPLNLHGGCLWSCNFAIEKKLFYEVGCFDEEFPFAAMEDLDFHRRVKSKEKIVFVPGAKVIHPWRIVKPFKGYKKWIFSNRYFMAKHNIKVDKSFRFLRIKILINQFFSSSALLVKYSFKGLGFF